jgi:hypothetical protein
MLPLILIFNEFRPARVIYRKYSIFMYIVNIYIFMKIFRRLLYNRQFWLLDLLSETHHVKRTF